jgi:hypothetical protein
MIAHESDRVQISCIALSECVSNPKISSVASCHSYESLSLQYQAIV